VGTSNSSVIAPAGKDYDEFLRLVQIIAGESQHRSRARGLIVLLPLVRRTIQTGQGPPCLVHWIRKALACRAPFVGDEEFARELTEELARFLIGPLDPLAETCVEC
jgi:hypothetical protein